jgi:hypothetical protein
MRIINDDFDVVAKKYLKLKSVSLENGIFKDKDDNFVVIIKKEGVSKEGFGVDLLKDNEGSVSWAKEILSKASIVNPINFRRIIIYHNPNMSNEIRGTNYIWSEYKNDVWKYIGSHEYKKREKTIVYSKDEAISRWVDWKKEDIDENFYSIKYIEKVLVEKINGMPNDSTAFWLRVDKVANESLTFAIYKRLVDNDINILINGIYTYGRLVYLTYFSPINNLFIFDLVKATAIYDDKLIKAYIQNNLEPLNKTRPSYIKALSNGMYAFFKNDSELKKQSREEIKKVIDQKTIRRYDRAILKCLDNVIAQDYENFLEPINEILNLHNNQETSYNDQAFLNFFSLPVLAFYNMAYFDKERKTPMPPEPVNPLWDSELWHEIIKDGQKREYIIDIEKVSPLLKKWMDELPKKIDLNELVESLK